MIEAGRESRHVSAFWDFLPTACDLAGIQTPENCDGISYLPELLGETQQKHESLYFEFHEQGGKQAIIKDNWKCIRLNLNYPEDPVVELYNLENDIQENNNLAAKFPEKVNELVSLMKDSRTENNNFKLYHSEFSETTEMKDNVVN
jgi:arylsulfatase A-like enzyme